ncbi:MAG: MATE family efflux transporter [Pseudomonadota bacterium]
MDQPVSPPAARASGALPGGPRDLTVGPIGKSLLLFALPVLGANILQSINGSINAIWVSHVLGEAALTATANANIILFLLIGAIFGIAMAASLLVGQAVGAHDLERVKRVVGASTGFFIVLSVVVAVLGFLFTPAILDAMQTPGDAKASAIAYLRVIFMAMPFLYLFAYVQMIQRGAGDARTPLYFSLLAVGLDVLLNPLLIMGVGPFPKLGIAGSATATLIAQCTSLCLLIAYLYKKKSPLVPRRGEWRYVRIDSVILKALLTRGLPMGAQMLVISGSAIAMMALVNRFGVQTAAAYGAANIIWTYVQMPAMAVGVSVSAMAAQNVGAKKWDRVDQVAREGVKLALIATTTPVAMIFLLHRPIVGLFLPAGSEAIVIAQAIDGAALWSFIFFSTSFALFGVVRATGAVIAPLLILVFTMWIVRVPVAAFATQYFGADAIWWSFPISSACATTLAVLYYKYGGWRKARMTDEPIGEAPDCGAGAPAMADDGPTR